MTLAFDKPDCPPSFLQRLDPRWKLASVLLAVLALALLRTGGAALAGLLGALLLVVLARLPWRWYCLRMGTALTMYLLFLIWLPLVVEADHDTFDLGIVTVSLTGLIRLFVLSANLVGMISLMLVLLATTPLHNVFKAARALYVSRLLVFLMLLTYRYVFLLIDEFARLRIALRVRGFRNRADLHSYRTIGQVAGTLLVRSAERSERVGQAMRCRGFDGEFRALDEFSTTPRDVLVFSVMAGYAIGLVAWDWFAR
ncbi:MAG: cobalt ECF transporter T component CbiQ [Planctomycetes bacterium]|nr:cobalt ECF transporter T component CbiQ [Planctomycetota bacterium]